MNEQKYRGIVKKFFGNDLPGPVQHYFQRWFLRTGKSAQSDTVLSELFDDVSDFDQPEVDADAHLARFKQKYNHRPSRKYQLFRKIYKVAMILLLPVLAGLLTYYYTSAESYQDMYQVSTRCGEQKIIHLPDGSTVWLNAGSTLIYPKKFDAKIRSIHLIGEGRFSVQKNEDLPFVVQTNDQKIEALGTIFTVKAYSNTVCTVTRLEEGLLRLSAKNSETYLLYPDQESVFDAQSGGVEIKRIDAGHLGLWYDGQLNFESASFDEITEAIARQYDIDFIYDPASNNSKVLNVKFNTKESLEQVLDVLVGLTDFSEYRIYGRNVYLK